MIEITGKIVCNLS